MINKLTILSPHLDDVIWSLGGYLKSLEGVCDIRVINIFSKQTLIYEKFEDPKLVSKIRKSEDRQALNRAGITDVRYLDIPESVLRGYPVDKMFLEAEAKLDDIAYRELENLLRDIINKEDVVLIPSAFGGHVDHYITRDVAVDIQCTHIFYEDLPYAARTIRRGIAENFLASKKKEVFPATKQNLQDHLRLIQIYKSQIAEHRKQQINDYIKERGFTLWT